MIINFDGTFQGFLSVLYAMSGYRSPQTNLLATHPKQDELFKEGTWIPSDPEKADKVWKKISRYRPELAKNLFFAFYQARITGAFDELVDTIHYALDTRGNSGRMEQWNNEIKLKSMAIRAQVKARSEVSSIQWLEVRPDIRVAVIQHLKVPEALLLHVLSTMYYGENFVCLFPSIKRLIARNYSRVEHYSAPLPSLEWTELREDPVGAYPNLWSVLTQLEGFTEYFSLKYATRSKSLTYNLAS